MKDSHERLLSCCSRMTFGTVHLSEGERAFYRGLNNENYSLCESLTRSLQGEALLFLERYSGISTGEEPDFFKNYYAPAWSVVYWLTQSFDGKTLSREDTKCAITAHAMALTLHSLDDHLCDGEVPVTHLTLLLRTQSWMMMTSSLARLASGVTGGDELVRDLIDRYYSGICSSERADSLDAYCDIFRKQISTWLTVPLLVSGKLYLDRESTAAVQEAFESFGIAWRLLDDVQDIGKDMKKCARSAVYACLPEDARSLWDQDPRGGSRRTRDREGTILDCILANGIVDRLREKACIEMESAASSAEALNLGGLAGEFRCLGNPLGIGKSSSTKSSVAEKIPPGVHHKVLGIEVTTRCNSACTHCFVRAGLTEPTTLPVELAKEIVSEGHTLGYRHLHLTGGEPLLWKGLFGLFDYAFDRGYTTVLLNTNGRLLTDRVVQRLAGYDGLSISVSLEGPAPLHDSVRGKGSYRQTVRGIDRALHAGMSVFIYTTARKSLLSDLPDFVLGAYKRFPGIRGLTFIQLIRVKNDVFDLSGELFDPDDFLSLVKMASLLNVFGYKVEILNNPLTAAASQLLGIWGIPRSAPLHRAGDLIVMADRSIAAAHSTQQSLGRYEPGILKSILSSDEYRVTVEPDRETCPACKYSSLCAEKGMLHPSKWYRDMNARKPYCQRVLEKIVQPPR